MLFYVRCWVVTPFIMNCWGHTMSKCYQYVTNDTKSCVKVKICSKKPMGLVYKKVKRPFLIFFTFSYDFFNDFFFNLLLKIHVIFSIYHMFCVNHCWINMIFSKYVKFAKFCVSSLKITIPKYANYFRFLFLIS